MNVDKNSGEQIESTDLDELRQRIRGIDYSIMALITDRIRLAKQVGVFKQGKNLPIRNFQVEKQVIDRIKRYAEEFQIDPNFAKNLYMSIIRASVDVQMELTGGTISKNTKKCLIYGGAGKMGSWMTQYLRSSGHICHIIDPKQSTEHMDDFDTYDFIVVSTPLKATRQVLLDIIEEHPKGVIFDIASLKSDIIDIIEKAQREGIKISSIHPMFGPDVISLENRNIIVCETSLSKQTNSEIVNLFTDTAANIVYSQLSQHDLYISYTLGLSHFINLLMGSVLEQSEFSLDNMLHFAGSTFSNQLKTTQEVFSENPELYHSIQNTNKFTPTLYKMIKNKLEEVQDMALNEDKSNFIEMMERVSNYLQLRS